MIFYNICFSYRKIDNPFDEHSEKTMSTEAMFTEINKRLGANCDEDDNLSFYIWDGSNCSINAIMAAKIEKVALDKCEKFIFSFFKEKYGMDKLKTEYAHEITIEEFNRLGQMGTRNGFLKRWGSEECEIGINFRYNRNFKYDEKLVSENCLTKERILEKARDIMADRTLTDEIERIFSPKNAKCFKGNPVHYRINVSNSESAQEIERILAQALYANNRILSRRINEMHSIKENCYDEEDVSHIFSCSAGSMLVMEFMDTVSDENNYASAYEEVVRFFSQEISEKHLSTLCVFVESGDKAVISKKIIGQLDDVIDVIDIKEGHGTKKEAIDYIKRKAKERSFPITAKEIEKALPQKEIISLSETWDAYDTIMRDSLKNRVYKAYKTCEFVIPKKTVIKNEPYEELKKMVGLSDIKKTVEDIVNTAKIRKMRKEMGLTGERKSMHMIFTGNPGSAKTTVARLLGEILYDEGIIDSPTFIECGRADMVGKYVGWTAKIVKEKFRRARDGILFIDEAYSLADKSGSFGDEAINTIVQEMENYRDRVIVIFAGYPDKMESFLEKNEGLRSRIAFHMNFPDYSPAEMTEILKLMAEKKGYVIKDEAILKCTELFRCACNISEFGNGRFVRNMLERAEMAQAGRLIRTYEGKEIGREEISTLCPEDFDDALPKGYAGKKKNQIGFLA